MKTIEEAVKENFLYKSYGYYGLCEESTHKKIFNAGVEFAHRRIPVEEELPDEKNGYINKDVIAFTSDNCAYVLIYDDYIGWLPNGTDADIDNITHWRPIEIA